MNPAPASLGDFEMSAKLKVPSAQWDWIVGAAETGRTYRQNLEQFRDFYLRPRVLTGVTAPVMGVPFFGHNTASPILAAPIGHMTQFHEGGELNVMEACKATGTHCVVSMHTRRKLELLAEAAGDAGWSYQVYLYSEPSTVISQINRAVRLGAASIVVTVDSSHRSPSYQRQQAPWDARKFGKRDEDELPETRNDRVWTWSMLAKLADRVSIPVIVKGIQFAEDAERARQANCKAVWISNHGGRVSETDQSLLLELVSIRQIMGFDLPIIVDGGFRSGSDIAKALLLGASHVALGRPLIHGLVVDGRNGVESVLNIAQRELSLTLGGLGVGDVRLAMNHADQIRHLQIPR